jgi:hypothetical protein
MKVIIKTSFGKQIEDTTMATVLRLMSAMEKEAITKVIIITIIIIIIIIVIIINNVIVILIVIANAIISLSGSILITIVISI